MSACNERKHLAILSPSSAILSAFSFFINLAFLPFIHALPPLLPRLRSYACITCFYPIIHTCVSLRVLSSILAVISPLSLSVCLICNFLHSPRSKSDRLINRSPSLSLSHIHFYSLSPSSCSNSSSFSF